MSISWHFFATRAAKESGLFPFTPRCRDSPAAAAPGSKMHSEGFTKKGEFLPGNCIPPPYGALTAIGSRRLLRYSRTYTHTNPHTFSVPVSRAVLLHAVELSCFPPEVVVVLLKVKQTLVVGSFYRGYTTAFTEHVSNSIRARCNTGPELTAQIAPNES